MEIVDSTSSQGSADWDWTMDELVPVQAVSLDAESSSVSPSPTKHLSETKLYDNLIVKSSPHPSYSKDLEEIIDSHNYYLHYLIYTCQVAAVSQLLHLSPLNLNEIVNFHDHWGNSPLFLAVKLCSRSREYLSLVRMLIEHGADLHEKDINGWTMIDEAVSQKNRELVAMIFDYLYVEKLISWEKNRKTAQTFLSALPDFYVEIKWQFSSNVIPLVSTIGPHDVCKLWKIGNKLRFDSTLAGWKNLRSKRRNISLIFDDELFIINHSKKIVVNPLEELDHEETNEIINDIMSAEPVQGNLSLLGHSLTQVKNWRGNTQSGVISSWKAYKYKIQFRTHATVTKKQARSKIGEDYFSNESGKLPKPVFLESPRHRKRDKARKPRVKAKSVRENTTSNFKNSTAFCWLCNEFPITIKELLAVLNVFKGANKTLERLHDFLENEGIATLLPEDSFPIKIEVPLSLGIKAKATFMNFSLLQPMENETFIIPTYNRVSRRIGQKTLTSPKKRLLFTNIVA